MQTIWADIIDMECPLPEYPRPQMVRGNWINLNGPWKYAVTQSSVIPDTFTHIITVPFSPETEVSGILEIIEEGDYLWYSRKITLPHKFSGKRLILHFGAVDQCATVWVNSVRAVEHVGGYLPFEADITDMVDGREVEITVMVTDNTEATWHTRGKQKTDRGRYWYTQQSGIWQTVWIEAVPETYIQSLKITPEFDEAAVFIDAVIYGDKVAKALFDNTEYELPAHIPVTNFEAWSPENPKLYEFSVICGEDKVDSYFAMRKFGVGTDSKGIKRLFLNGKPYFHNGILDQGYWPEGLYTPSSDEAMIWDIRTMKECGFNMLRKHIKVEPLRWYYHCDRLGMLVWQDMPCGGGQYKDSIVVAPLFTRINIRDNHYGAFARKDVEGRNEFTNELREMIRHLYNCPCIAMWVPFNEGWGQFDAKKIFDVVLELDTTRTIDHASGWHDQGIGDFKSIHVYFRKYRFRKDRRNRAVLLSEFGGYALQIKNHVFNEEQFGYAKYKTPEKLAEALESLYNEQIRPAVEKGLAAAVYTQVSDVEDEVNGIATYDRKVIKIPTEKLRKIFEIQYDEI